MTKSRGQLIQEIKSQLDDAGFNLSTKCDLRPTCFDMVARRGGQLLLIKVLTNVDALTKEDALALQLVAHFFEATPVVIGRKTRRGKLDAGVVYRRYGVPTIEPKSFNSIVTEKEMPKEFIQRGGRFVSIDGARLKDLRQSRSMTKEELADSVDVSTRTILSYEKNEVDVSKDVAERLEQVLDAELVVPVNLFEEEVIQREDVSPQEPSPASFESRVNEFFKKLGMRVLWTDRAPFHLAAKEEGPPLMSSVGSIRSWALKKRTDILRSVSDVTDSSAVIIVEEGKAVECLAELPVIRQLELGDIEKPNELKKIIAERSEK
ncbi:MAG: transcriptional regulator [Candidatus Lokiarchaeota archaeon]|nr:transcriptional regulator [Candidatus Lokiarchaeota archaeon]